MHRKRPASRMSFTFCDPCVFHQQVDAGSQRGSCQLDLTHIVLGDEQRSRPRANHITVGTSFGLNKRCLIRQGL